MSGPDLAVLALYFAAVAGFGVYTARRRAADVDNFFVAGRKLPWWLAGTSMVAATFSADTPLAVTGFVAQEGVAGNWLWWNMAFCHLLAAVFFARLWRRTGVLTDAGLIEKRYAGRPAEVLRAVKAFYFAVPINALIIGWSALAMVKIARVIAPAEQLLGSDGAATLARFWPFPGDAAGGLTVAVCTLLLLTYSLSGGMAGMSKSGFAQFILAVIGAFMLAAFAVRAQGGLGALVGKLHATYPQRDFLAYVPAADSLLLPLPTFLTYAGVLWWAQKYADGGGLIIQRMAAARDERQAYLGTLWFCFAHYVLRTWPWILAGLAALVAYPLATHKDLDREAAYVLLMRDYLPPGLLGLMAASLVAAFMSTIDAQLNWGASYLVNDIYRRFWRPGASERELLWVSRAAMVVLLVVALLTLAQMETIGAAWKFLLALGSGLGLVTLARWFWWRVNAWSELSALAASTLTAATLSLIAEPSLFGGENPLYLLKITFVQKLFLTLGISTLVWVAVTLLTPAEPAAKLRAFFREVRPGGPGWKPIRAAEPGVAAPESLLPVLREFAVAVIFIFAALFGIGELLLGVTWLGLVLCAASAAAAVHLIRGSGNS